MPAYTPISREERLLLLKQRQENLAKIKTGFDQSTLKLENGITIVRILPAVGNMNPMFYHQAVGYHMIGKTVVRCSEFTTSYDVKCPVCEVIEVLRRGGPTDKKRAESIKLTKRYWMNVIKRGERDNFDTAEGPFILKAGVTIFDRTRSLTNDPDYGLIDDLEQGIDLKVEKTGSGLETKYEINPRKGNYQPLIIGPDGKLDMAAAMKIMEACRDFTPILMPNDPKEDEAFLEALGFDPHVKVYGYERTILQYGVCLETIHELDAIIAANMQGQGEGAESVAEEGSQAKPLRTSGGPQSAPSVAATSVQAIKDRIAALRNKQA